MESPLNDARSYLQFLQVYRPRYPSLSGNAAPWPDAGLPVFTSVPAPGPIVKWDCLTTCRRCLLVVAASLGPASLSLRRWGPGLLALPLPVFDAGGWASWCCQQSLLLGVASRMLPSTPLTPNRYVTRIGKKIPSGISMSRPQALAESADWALP